MSDDRVCRLLAARVRAAMAPGNKERYAAGKQVVRTYHEPDNRVTDHATGEQVSYSRTVGKGDLSGLIERRARHLATVVLNEKVDCLCP